MCEKLECRWNSQIIGWKIAQFVNSMHFARKGSFRCSFCLQHYVSMFSLTPKIMKLILALFQSIKLLLLMFLLFSVYFHLLHAWFQFTAVQSNKTSKHQIHISSRLYFLSKKFKLFARKEPITTKKFVQWVLSRRYLSITYFTSITLTYTLHSTTYCSWQRDWADEKSFLKECRCDVWKSNSWESAGATSDTEIDKSRHILSSCHSLHLNSSELTCSCSEKMLNWSDRKEGTKVSQPSCFPTKVWPR